MKNREMPNESWAFLYFCIKQKQVINLHPEDLSPSKNSN